MQHKNKLRLFKLFFVILGLALILLPQTVVRTSELNSRAIVEVIGIDNENNEYTVSAQLILPTTKDSEPIKTVASAKGSSMGEALNMLDVTTGRSMAIGQCTTVVLGKDVKDSAALEFLWLSTDVTSDVYIVASEKSAKEFLTKLNEFMTKTGNTDSDIIFDAIDRSRMIPQTLSAFVSDLHSPSRASFAPLISFGEDSGGSGESGGSGSSGESGGSGSGSSSGGGGSGSSGESGGSGGEKELKGMQVDSLVVYSKGESYTAGKELSRSLALAKAKSPGGTIDVEVEYKGRKHKLTCSLESIGSNIAVGDNARLTVSAELKIQNSYGIEELTTGNKAVDFLRSVAKAFEEEAKRECEIGYEQAMEKYSDPFGVKNACFRQSKDDNVELEFAVKARVRA